MSDKAALFEARVLPELGTLYAAARRLGHSDGEAEDLVQETMVRAFAAFEPGSPPLKPRAWAHTILLNLIRDRARKSSRDPAELSIDDEGAGLHDRLAAGRETGIFSDPARLITRWNNSSAVRDAVAALPEWGRQVLVLTHVGGLSYAEIAEALDIPVGTVMSRLSRARRAVERALADSIGAPEVRVSRVAPPHPVDDDSARRDRMKSQWGGAPAAVDALAASSDLLRSADLALRAVVEDGALSADLKRYLLTAIETGEPGERDSRVHTLARFAIRVAAEPGGLTDRDYAELYGLGWNESEVLEALHVASWAQYMARLNLALGGAQPTS